MFGKLGEQLLFREKFSKLFANMTARGELKMHIMVRNLGWVWEAGERVYRL